MKTSVNWKTTALIIVDPQIDLLPPEGAAWDLFGEQVHKRETVKKLALLRDAAQAAGATIFYSSVQVTEEDYEAWNVRNGLQKIFLDRKLMLEGAGARFLPELEPTAETILLSPRKGPSSVQSDVAEQLRHRGLDTIVVAGMASNLCVESQVRDATDGGFNAIVVGDAIATLSDEAHDSAIANFGFLATDVVSTHEILESLEQYGISSN